MVILEKIPLVTSILAVFRNKSLTIHSITWNKSALRPSNLANWHSSQINVDSTIIQPGIDRNKKGKQKWKKKFTCETIEPWGPKSEVTMTWAGYGDISHDPLSHLSIPVIFMHLGEPMVLLKSKPFFFSLAP